MATDRSFELLAKNVAHILSIAKYPQEEREARLLVCEEYEEEYREKFHQDALNHIAQSTARADWSKELESNPALFDLLTKDLRGSITPR